METVNPALFSSMEWRLIGPFRGGRVVAVAGDPHDPMTFYFGACAGGVWKTTDGGTYWRNVTDGFLNVSAVGAVAVASSDSNVIYVGTGEACLRANVCHGDGIIPLHRRRSNLGPPGPRRHSPRLQSARTSPKPGPGLRCGHGPRLRPQRTAWHLPLHRWRRFLGKGPVQESPRRRLRPLNGPQQPQNPFRRHL